jgi:hypothetical protein
MASAGLGAVTGLYSTQTFDHAILVDNGRVFDSVKKSLEEASTEREGLPGFRSIVGSYRNTRIALVQIPAYPQAVAEAVSELYVMGARRVIMIGRGYRLSRRLSPESIVIAIGSVPRDSISLKIAPKGAPLLASSSLYNRVKNLATLRFPDLEWFQGLTVTLDSSRLKWALSEAEELVGLRGVLAAETFVAPLYALQYEYTNLEAVAIVTAFRQYSRVASPIESPADTYTRLVERESKIEGILYTVALDAVTMTGEER